MSTSELNKGQPILSFLAPTGANAAPFGQPTESPFNDPTAWGMLLVLGNRFRQWFTPPTTVGNMFFIIGIFDNLMNIVEIVGFVQTQMLLAIGASDDNRENQVINRPFVMLISPGDMNRQWSAAFVNQDMNLSAPFSTVGRIATRRLAAQRRWHRFAVNGLPLPADATLSSIEANHRLKDFVPDTFSLPALESLMQDTAGDAEPITVNGLPLAACPQYVPDAVDDGSVVCTRSADTSLLGLFGQVPFDSSPQWAWNSEIIDIFGLCVTLVFVHLHLYGNGFE
jgi:hypothetical protein